MVFEKILNYFKKNQNDDNEQLTKEEIKYIQQEEDGLKSLNEIWDEYMCESTFQYTNEFKLERFQSWLNWWYSPITLMLMYQALLSDIELARENKDCYMTFSNHLVSKFRLFENKFKSNNKSRFIEIYKKRVNCLNKLYLDEDLIKTVNENTDDILNILK